MHDGMQYDPIQSQGQDHEPVKVGNQAVFKSYFVRHLQWELATDHGYYGTKFKLVRAAFLISGLVLLSSDFEVASVAKSLPSVPVRG